MRADSGRQQALRAVLLHAATRPDHCLPFDAVPEARRHFADRRSLLLALQAEWSRVFWAQVERLSLARDATQQSAPEIAAAAHDRCRRRHAVLRELLDRHAEELGTGSFTAPVTRSTPAVRTPRAQRVACPA